MLGADFGEPNDLRQAPIVRRAVRAYAAALPETLLIDGWGPLVRVTPRKCCERTRIFNV